MVTKRIPCQCDFFDNPPIECPHYELCDQSWDEAEGPYYEKEIPI